MPDHDVVIDVRALRKEFRVAKRDPGFRAAVGSFFRPRRETVVAVDDVSFTVQRGELLGYLGPNGAGKSTTIKLLTGILVPTTGTATVGGVEPYAHRTENAKRIGVVFGQRTQLWWDLPAQESFHILRDLYDLDAATFTRQIEKLDGDLAFRQFQRKGVVLEDLRVAPALRPVELGHHHGRPRAFRPAGIVLQKDLEDAVLVAVERQQPAVAAQADALQRVEHRVRRQAFVRL